MPPNDIKVSGHIIPLKLDNSVNTEVLVDVISNILLYKESDTKNGNHFPYHLILSEWVESFLHFPPSTVENVGGNVVKVTFHVFIPTTFQLITDQFYNQGELYISNTNDFSNCTKKFNSYSIQTTSGYTNEYKPIDPNSTNNIFYLKFINHTNVEYYHFKVYSYSYLSNKDISKLVYSFRNLIKDDCKDFNTKFTQSEDQKILNYVYSNKFSIIPMDSRPTLYEIEKMAGINHPLYLINLRAIYIFTINYLFLNEKAMSIKLSENNSLERFFLNGIFSGHFRKLIDNHNSNYYVNMEIDRQKGLDYRNGINNLVSNSMIAQFTESYIKKPNSFRNKSKPFSRLSCSCTSSRNQ